MAEKKLETPCENCKAMTERVMEQENKIRELQWMLKNYKALERLSD